MSTDHLQQETARLPAGGARAKPAPSRPQGGRRDGQPHYQINWLLLIVTAVVAAIVIPGAHFWHRRQLRRNGSAFLVRAEALKEENKWGEAADNLYRYIRLFPTDEQTDQVRIDLARTYDLSAQAGWEKSRAIELYATAIALAPSDEELRLRQAELLFELGRYPQAMEHIEKLWEIHKEDPKLLRLRAQCAYRTDRGTAKLNSTKVVDKYKDALQYQEDVADEVQLTKELAYIYRDDLAKTQQRGGPTTSDYVKDADELIDRMVQKHPDDVSALAGRCEYRRTYGLEGADEDLDRALALDKNHQNVLVCLFAAERAVKQNQPDAAVKYYEYAIQAAKEDFRGYLGLGVAYRQRRDFEGAIGAFRRGLDNVPRSNAFLLQYSLIETLLNDGRLSEAAELLDAMDQGVAEMTSRSPGPEANRRRATALILRGRWHMARRDLNAAVDKFNQALAGMTGLTDTDKDRLANRGQIYLLIGNCYVQLRKWDQAAVAFNEAVALAPGALEPKLAAARAWQAAGRLDEAIRLYGQASSLANAPEGAWVGLAEARLQQVVRLADEERDWKEFDAVLSAGLKAFPNSVALKMLDAQAADLRGGSGQTLALLETVHAKSPDSFALAERLVLGYEAARRGADADRVVREFEQQAKDARSKAAGVALRSALLTRRGQLDEAEKLLRAALPSVPSELQADFKFRLATLALRRDRKKGRAELAELAESPAAQSRLVPLLAELALESRDLPDLERWESKLHEQEGDDGSLWRYFRAQRLIAAAKNTEDPGNKEAQRLTTEILAKRPSWAAGYVLQGHIAQRLGDRPAAIDAYKKAIERGARQSFVFEQLTALLYAANRMAEANEYLKRLGSSVEQSSQLAGLAIPIQLRQGNLERAIEIAQQNLKSHAGEPAAHLWLGQTFLTADKKPEAEASFRRAVELGPHDAAAWQGLFGFYSRTGQTAAARETLTKMIDAVKLPEKKRNFVLAQGYESLGERELARKHYKLAVEDTRDDPAVFERAAIFFSGEDRELAETYQRRFLELSPNSDLARRGLVSMLIGRGTDESLDQAEKLLAINSVDESLDQDDQRLKAMLYMRRGGNDGREKARRLLDDLARTEKASPSDRLLLAGLLEGDGNLRAADDQMRTVASRDDAPPHHVTAYIEMLLRNAHASEVEPWIDRLVKAAPNAYPTVSVRTRWLAAMQRRDAARPIIEAFLAQRLAETSNEAEIAQAHLAAGRLYEQAGLDQEAERSYRDLARLTPRGYVPLANWLATHQRVAEAVSLCLEKASSDSTAQPVIALAHALIAGNAPAVEMARAEPVLSQAIASHSDAPDLIFSIATLRLLAGKKGEAENLFREVLRLNPKNSLALNNLASLIAEDPKPQRQREALQMIDKAISLDGRNNELLDTKGMILLRFEDKLPEAIRNLEDVTQRPTSDPRHLFHLSLAYHKGKKFEEAKRTLSRARERSLNAALLSPDERQLLLKLEKDLGG